MTHLKAAKDAEVEFTATNDKLINTVHLDSGTYAEALFMQPCEMEKLRNHYKQDLAVLINDVKTIIAELERIEKVNENDDDLVEETVLNTDLQNPTTLVHLGARS